MYLPPAPVVTLSADLADALSAAFENCGLAISPADAALLSEAGLAFPDGDIKARGVWVAQRLEAPDYVGQILVEG